MSPYPYVRAPMSASQIANGYNLSAVFPRYTYLRKLTIEFEVMPFQVSLCLRFHFWTVISKEQLPLEILDCNETANGE